MILSLLLAAAVPQAAAPQTAVADAGALMKTAADRLAATCDGPECAAPPASDRYRIVSDNGATVTSKDRAIRDDGTRCNVVGFKRCTSSGATILTTRQ